MPVDFLPDPERLRWIPWLRNTTGLSESGFRRLVRQGVLPAIRIGRYLVPAPIHRDVRQRRKRGRRSNPSWPVGISSCNSTMRVESRSVARPYDEVT